MVRFLLVSLMFLAACAKVDAPDLSDVPQIPKETEVTTETYKNDDAVTKDELEDIIRKRTELLNSGDTK